MKFLLTAVFFLCNTPLLYSQTIDINSAPAQSSFTSNTFQAGDGTVTVSGNQFVLGSAQIANPLAWSLSTSNRRASFLQSRGDINLLSYNAKGDVLLEQNLEFFSSSDNTVNTYQFDNGRIVLRDNVANFSFLNAWGETAYQVSNSSGSTDGEKESQLVSNPSGTTVVLYNPVIAYGSETGSRARFVYSDQDTEVFFTSKDHEITNICVSEAGEFITIVTSGGGGSSVIVFDRFGNKLFQISVDENLTGATLTGNASYLTIYSSSRVQVYKVPGGERLGSASSRSSIFYAAYDSAAQTIIALGGRFDGIRIEEPEITAVSISEREIARKDIPFSLSTLNVNRINLSTLESNSYKISGLNRDLLVDIAF